MSNSYQLLPTPTYIKELIRSVDQARDGIDIIALTVAESEKTTDLIDALCRASKRGVTVTIGFDLFFSYREIEKTSKRWWVFWNRTQHLQQTRRRLHKAGVKVYWLGQFSPFLFFRRTHTKWSLVDDTVFSFGGVNLYRDGIENLDYMFRVDDKELVNELRAEHQRIVAADRAGRTHTSHLFGTVSHTVLIDGGKLFDSIIYRHALSYAREASHIIYVSQYTPTGKLGSVLRNHNNAALYFNHWRNANDIFNRLLIRWHMFTQGFRSQYDGSRYLHAKFMIFTMPNGKEVAITGSHNFVAGGGWLGTREVALETTDQDIIKQLRDFLDKQLST